MRILVPWPQLWLGASRRTVPLTPVQPRPGRLWVSHRSYAAGGLSIKPAAYRVLLITKFNRELNHSGPRVSVVPQKSLPHSWNEARDHGVDGNVGGRHVRCPERLSVGARGPLVGPVVDSVAESPLVLVLRAVVFGRCLSIDTVTGTGPTVGPAPRDRREASAPSWMQGRRVTVAIGQPGEGPRRRPSLHLGLGLLASGPGREQHVWLKPRLFSL